MQGIRPYRKRRPARAKGALRIERVTLVSSYHPWGLRAKQVGVPGTQKCGEGHPRAQLTLGVGSSWELEPTSATRRGKELLLRTVSRKSKGRNEVLSPTSRHAV